MSKEKEQKIYVENTLRKLEEEFYETPVEKWKRVNGIKVIEGGKQ